MTLSPYRIAAGVVFLLGISAVSADTAPPTALSKAYSFLYREMDLYGQGASLRLVRSYVPTPTFSNADIGYVYDVDAMIIALLRRAQPEDIARARVLGDTLAYAQAHDPYADGRVRNGYYARGLTGPNGALRIAAGSSDTGNLAWTGLAWAQLYASTREHRYLSAALAIAKFIQANAYDTRGAGGYSGGLSANQKKLKYKSTEHNIDLYGLFTILAQLTGDRRWTAEAQRALVFVKSMWNERRGYFYIGTGLDGVAVNKDNPTPEDVQTWSFLSTGLSQYAKSIDWALANLSAMDGDFRGLSFEATDRTGVWFEGTAHAAAALEARRGMGDADTAGQLLSSIEFAQARGPNADGQGIVAASKDGLRTGNGGDKYYASLHISATAWYCLAKQSANPFRSVATQ